MEAGFPNLRRAWLLAGALLLASGANLLIGVAAARLIGISEFGKFTVVLIVAAFVQALQASLVSVPMMTATTSSTTGTPE